MLNTIGDIQDEILVRLEAGTATSGLYTDTILNDWINQSHRWASGYRKWPFTEGKVSTTLSLDGQDAQDYPEGWKADSIRIVQIGGKRYQKLNYEDWLIFREDRASDDEKVYSDFARRLFVNPNGASGTLAVFGQYTPAPIDVTDKGAITVFSNNEDEGNEAMLLEMISFAKTREGKPKEAEYWHRRAIEILNGIWERVGEEQFGYHSKNRGMFKRIDVLEGALEDELLKRDQFF